MIDADDQYEMYLDEIRAKVIAEHKLTKANKLMNRMLDEDDHCMYRGGE